MVSDSGHVEGVDPSDIQITFPSENYPVKIMGLSGEAFQTFAFDVVPQHAPDFDASTAEIQNSSNGKYQSIRIKITATGVDQLRSLNDALRKSELVKVVL